MKKKRINDYIEESASAPFYEDGIFNNSMISDFLKDNDFQDGLCNTISDLYGNYPLRQRYIHIRGNDLTNETVILEGAVIKSVMTVYVRNKYKYDKLYETLNFEYNPLDNVDEHDEWTETHSGQDVNTENVGSKTSNQKIGNRSDSLTMGKSTNEQTHNEAPFNTDSYHSKSIDMYEQGSRTDTSSIGEQNNQFIEGAQENKDTFEHGHVIHYKRDRHGNIGVTSAFQLINQARETALFSLYEIIATDIKNQLCSGVLN